MRLHEHQARTLLTEAGIPVPPGRTAGDPDEAATIASELLSEGADQVVVKAQVHAGGRGKAGFVRLVATAEEARDAAAFMLTHRMVSPQTGAEGLAVATLLLVAAVDIERELYLALAVDRARGTCTIIASAEGGVDIEVVAAQRPGSIHELPLGADGALPGESAQALSAALGLDSALSELAVDLVARLAECFVRIDASMLEINPLVVTADGRLLAIDAKCTLDDNALYRHPDLAALVDPAEEDPRERRAREHGLSWVGLDGDIGCLVNGAGLAMSTMDIIKLHGGEPANFLDVGGSADDASVTEAFRIILADPGVRGVLVNIFGGIMPCDRIARAIVTAAGEVGFTVPLVVRLEGTNVEAALQVLDEAREILPTMRTASDLEDAAAQVTAAVVTQRA